MTFNPVTPDEKIKKSERQFPRRFQFLLTNIYVRTAIISIVSTIIIATLVSLIQSRPGFYPATGRIAYVSGTVQAPNLLVMDANTGAFIQILSDKIGWVDWSPDGQKLVFSNGDYGLFIMDADGSNKTHLIRGEWASYPAWSPLGDKVAYSFYDDIYVIDVDGKNPTNLTENFGVVNGLFGLDWSPDGSKIVFSCRLQSDYGLCVMNADGSDAKELVMSPDYEANLPTWSPDGTKIAFVLNQDDRATIYWVNSDGTGMTRILKRPIQTHQTNPTWSPDSQQIAFTACGPTEATYEIYRVYLDGTGLTQLTDNTTMDTHPRWSP